MSFYTKLQIRHDTPNPLPRDELASAVNVPSKLKMGTVRDSETLILATSFFKDDRFYAISQNHIELHFLDPRDVNNHFSFILDLLGESFAQ